MPPWDLLWLIMCWAFYLLACIGAAILIFAVAVGLYRAFQQARRRK